ncbi:MAG: DegT/DnrJ/EryC1/StrS family aminotransferase, partial [Gemmatimonadota bacterium]|nr:DegT/DnrJ/EryC1/StrS family aminotransferase [Gemmatimonadota bacterium]
MAALSAGVAAVVSGGEARDRLRQRVRDRLGAVEACLTDSGTTALGLALLAAKRLRSIPVALPAWSCFDVATAADAADVPVVLYDLDPLTLGPNFVSLERALDRGAKSVVVAHHYGVPVDVARAARLAAQHRALLIEDAAQGVGIRFGDQAAGSVGSLGVLSFGRGKGRTGGGGGALV